MEIAVIGGGHGAYAAAAHLSRDGHAVRMWRRDAKAFASLLDKPIITLTDWQGTDDVPVHLPTTDLAAAVGGAELVVIPLPCTAQAPLARQLAPIWRDGQTVFLPPGTFGSYIFAKSLRQAGNSARVAFAETGTLPYLARRQGENHVRISVYATRLPTGVLPATESERAIGVISQAYPMVEPLLDALDGALMNAGPIIHPPLILMNAGPLQHFDAWDIHNEGTQPAIRSVTDALDNERIALRQALGYAAPHFPLADHYDDGRDEWMYGNASHQRLTDSGDWREHIDLATHRYMREDTVIGLSFLVSLGRMVDLELPIAQGFIAIASAILGEDAYGQGRTMEALGLAAGGLGALRAMLKEGPVA